LDAPSIDQVRRFNRTTTERVGALNDRFLGRDLSLGEARLLWEIGEGGARSRELGRRLGLDSAHARRLLRSLEKRGLIVVKEDETDKGNSAIKLTQSGLQERAELDGRADAFARSLLEPLTDAQRGKLLAAMAQVERLLVASMVRVTVADPTSKDARWCIEEYLAELDERFDTGFDPSRSSSADAHELTPPAGLLLVARLREEPVGCGAVKFHGNAVGELKRMWVAPEMRGLGVGRRLLLALEESARGAGMKVLRLETHRALSEAIELYRRSGYLEVGRFSDDPYADHWFEKRL